MFILMLVCHSLVAGLSRVCFDISNFLRLTLTLYIARRKIVNGVKEKEMIELFDVATSNGLD
jgi:hypothetical protein